MKPSTPKSIHVACAALALAAPAAQPGPLGGHTSQAEPVIGKVTRSRHVVAVTPAYDQKCQAGGDAFSWTQFRPAKLTKRHTFATRGSSRDTFDDGYAIAETYRVSGKVTKSGVRGTFQVHDKWYAPDGSVDDVCDTGKVSFRISDPNVLAGKTSDGAPAYGLESAIHSGGFGSGEVPIHRAALDLAGNFRHASGMDRNLARNYPATSRGGCGLAGQARGLFTDWAMDADGSNAGT